MDNPINRSTRAVFYIASFVLGAVGSFAPAILRDLNVDANTSDLVIQVLALLLLVCGALAGTHLSTTGSVVESPTTETPASTRTASLSSEGSAESPTFVK